MYEKFIKILTPKALNAFESIPKLRRYLIISSVMKIYHIKVYNLDSLSNSSKESISSYIQEII